DAVNPLVSSWRVAADSSPPHSAPRRSDTSAQSERLSSSRTQRARPPADMENCKLSALLSLIGGILFILPHCFGKNVPIRLQTGDNSSLSEGKGEGRPRVTRSAVACDSGFDEFCMNNGKCMLLVDLNERHCRCDIGFYGPRCSIPEMVHQKMAEEEIVLIVFCVGLLLIGLAGASYFFFKWYKKNKFPRQQKRQGYTGVQLV
ncbi:hypothetical protein OJAV_G00087050, partial [Oryzias javanicus]